MEYISAREAAEKWSISLRYVQRLLHEERIPGARKYGVSWMIPAEAKRPSGRTAPPEGRAQEDGPLTLFPVARLRGGDLEGAYKSCGSDPERKLLDAGLALFRCDAAGARDMASALLKEAATPRQKLGGGTILALAYMSLGDLRGWKSAVAQMEALETPESRRMEKELMVALAKAAMHGRSGCPRWIETGAYEGLSPELFPVARYVFVKLLYIKWKEVELLAAAEPLIAESHRDGCDLSEIYLRLLAATAYHDHGDEEQAAKHIKAAAELALPLGLISPFIEHGRQLPRITDACLKEKYPGQSAVIKKLSRLFLDNWTKMYNQLWEHPLAELTPRESEACSLFSRGMEVNEIARRMGISKNSVKKYLNVAYNKMDIRERNQIRRLVHS